MMHAIARCAFAWHAGGKQPKEREQAVALADAALTEEEVSLVQVRITTHMAITGSDLYCVWYGHMGGLGIPMVVGSGLMQH
jgi:hypothetical protein